MNKKILSLMLALFLMLVPAAVANAEETVNISISSVVYTFDVQVDTSIASGLTMKIVPLTAVPASDPVAYTEGAPIYLDECTTYTACPIDASLNRYTFDTFNVFSTTTTGKYRVIINGTYTKDFDFVNKTDKIAFYNSLAAATVSTWESALSAGVTGGVVDFDLGNYFSYDAAVKTRINKCLDALALTDLASNPTDDAVTAFETLLKPEVARVLKVADMATAANTDFASKVTAYGGDLGLDLTYYNDPVLELSPAAVCDRLSVTDYSVAEVQEAFDLACLFAIIDTADFGTVTEALSHYNGGCVNLNTSATTGFTPAELNSVSNLIKIAANTLFDADDIESAYVTAAAEVLAGRGQGGGFDTPSLGGNTITGSTTPPTVVPPAPAGTFSDLDEAPWAKTAIEALAKKGILSGKGDGKFHPNDIVTREEFVKIIVEAIDIYEKDATVDFDDVAADRWSYSYIASAYRAGIIQGTSDREFSPAGQMSRQDMAVIMLRVADLLGIELKGSAKFSDDAAIASYAKEAVKKLAGAGIINGVGNNEFSPRTTVTRAQAAKVVYELLVYGGMN